jgi:hypothetical protein
MIADLPDVRHLDCRLRRLPVLRIGPREAAAGAGSQVAARVSPSFVIALFEQQGCRLIGLERSTTEALPGLDPILEMREL